VNKVFIGIAAAVVLALAGIGATSVGSFIWNLPARYTNWQATHAWLAEAIPGTKGANGQPLNRSAVLDALVQQAIRQSAQQQAPASKPPAVNAPAPAAVEKPAGK
jgi:hypothetical protein